MSYGLRVTRYRLCVMRYALRGENVTYRFRSV